MTGRDARAVPRTQDAVLRLVLPAGLAESVR